jgi:hypothetical protein
MKMKIFETPVINIKEFSRVSILTDSTTTPEKTDAVAAAKAALNDVKTQNTSIFEFAAS